MVYQISKIKFDHFCFHFYPSPIRNIVPNFSDFLWKLAQWLSRKLVVLAQYIFTNTKTDINIAIIPIQIFILILHTDTDTVPMIPTNTDTGVKNYTNTDFDTDTGL